MISLELVEWDQVHPADDARLRGFRLTDPIARRVAQDLTEQRVLEISGHEDGLAVRSFSHVGRVELEGLTVTIRPKLAAGAMIELLRYAYSLRDLRLLDETQFKTGMHGLQDLLIAQLQSEARELIRRGVVRRYVRSSEELTSPRGRLEIARLGRRQTPTATTVPCVHYPRSSDFVLNQVVRAGLELAHSLAVAPILRRGVAHTAATFAEVATAITLTSAVLRAARRGLDRLSAHYEPVCRLIEILYCSSSLELDEGTSKIPLKGFLFDMNRFFQALLSKFLRESLPDCRLENEVPLRGMISYAAGCNPRGRRAPQPRPDFLVTRGNERFLLDAKYRDLWRDDLPRDMLYQLAIYAMSQPRGATAAILYPTDDAAATEAIVDIREPMTDVIRAHVALRPVVIPRLLELLRTPRLRLRERETLAMALVFGN
jgi:5-methylcytosine-specific restriction enzyme subunit McrC